MTSTWLTRPPRHIPQGQALGGPECLSPQGAEQEGEAGGWLNLKQYTLRLGRLMGDLTDHQRLPFINLGDSKAGQEAVGLFWARREARLGKVGIGQGPE